MRILIGLVLCPIASFAAPQVMTDFTLAPGTSGTLDGIRIAAIPVKPSTAEVVKAALPQDGWTVTCDSSAPGNDCSNAIDGSADTFWQTDPSAPLPHSITVDLQTTRIVGNITIEPRQDGNLDGNIGQHQVSLR